MGLESLKDCFQIGSANRHVYSHAGHKLKRHIKSFESRLKS